MFRRDPQGSACALAPLWVAVKRRSVSTAVDSADESYQRKANESRPAPGLSFYPNYAVVKQLR